MNKQKLASSIVLLFSLFLMVSCTNEPVDPTLAAQLAAANAATTSGVTIGGTTATYYVKAQVDGVQKEWDFCAAQFTNMNLLITGIDSPTSSNFTSVAITVINDVSSGSTSISTGVYPLSAFANCGFSDVGNNSYNSTYSNLTYSPGNITITQIDTVNKTVKGTFSFIGKSQSSGTKQFTNGEFFVNYL